MDIGELVLAAIVIVQAWKLGRLSADKDFLTDSINNTNKRIDNFRGALNNQNTRMIMIEKQSDEHYKLIVEAEKDIRELS